MAAADHNGASRRIVLLGPPGAGKGTQAGLLSSRLALPRISTGDMLREAIAARSELGQRVASLMERGQLVPDDLLLGVIQARLAGPDCASGYILDGFPRTLRQAQDFQELVGQQAVAELKVADVEVPRAELLRRLSGRRWCPTCQSTYHVDTRRPRQDMRCDRDGSALIQREDDKETAVARRLAEYDERTAPLVDHYRGRSRFRRIDGSRPVEKVFDELRGFVEGC